MLKNKLFSSKSNIIIFSFGLLALALLGLGFFLHAYWPETVVKWKVETNEVGTTGNLEEYVKQCQFDIPKGAEIVGVEIVHLDVNETIPFKTNRENRRIQWGIPYYYVENIEISESCGKDALRRSRAMGQGTLTSYLNDDISAVWSSDTNIRANKVSKELGFDVTKSYQVSTSQTIHIPADKTYELAAFPIYTLYKFDVFYSPIIGTDVHAGTGQAHKPSGVCFVWYEMPFSIH